MNSMTFMNNGGLIGTYNMGNMNANYANPGASGGSGYSGIHATLNAASIAMDATGVGAAFSWVPDLMDAGLSAFEGDWTGAGISMGAMIPGIGIGANAGKLGHIAKGASVPGRVQSRINLSNDGIAHVLSNHLSLAKSGNKSQFTLSESELRSLLSSKSTVQAPAMALETGNFARTITTSRAIGNLAEKMGGGSTNTFTVITDEFGNLLTAFPGGL
jgi:hypothetical protein